MELCLLLFASFFSSYVRWQYMYNCIQLVSGLIGFSGYLLTYNVYQLSSSVSTPTVVSTAFIYLFKDQGRYIWEDSKKNVSPCDARTSIVYLHINQFFFFFFLRVKVGARRRRRESLKPLICLTFKFHLCCAIWFVFLVVCWISSFLCSLHTHALCFVDGIHQILTGWLGLMNLDGLANWNWILVSHKDLVHIWCAPLFS